MNNIYLIGMPGCGKSTIGNILSVKLGMKHIDADVYLEEKYKKNITDIFAVDGEDAFRIMESQVISELSEKSNIIVSTGGGVVTRECNMSPMKNSGVIIFLDSEPDTILKNSSLSGRPLLKDKGKIFNLYESRIGLYKKFADFAVKNNSTTEFAVMTIINKLQQI